MNKKLIALLSLIIIITVSFSGCQDEEKTIIDQKKTTSDISIACWNLQIFGETKASNDTLLQYYAEKLDDHDIFIIQEIRDASGNAIKKLATKFPGYEYVISERAGKSTSKEQYAIFYKKDTFTVRGATDNTEKYQPMFQRPPYEINFRVNNWSFTIFTIHTSPDFVYQEMGYFESIVGNPKEATILIGDMNADGYYYDEKSIAHFTDWIWVIPNHEDTTVAASNNTYDRIIINDYANEKYKSYGIMDDVTKEQSDHYMIYAIFSPGD